MCQAMKVPLSCYLVLQSKDSPHLHDLTHVKRLKMYVTGHITLSAAVSIKTLAYLSKFVEILHQDSHSSRHTDINHTLHVLNGFLISQVQTELVLDLKQFNPLPHELFGKCIHNLHHCTNLTWQWLSRFLHGENNKANLRDLIVVTGLVILLKSDPNQPLWPWNLTDDLEKHTHLFDSFVRLQSDVWNIGINHEWK